MRRAFESRRRESWPNLFADAMESPILSRLVLIEALHGETRRVMAGLSTEAEGVSSPEPRKALKDAFTDGVRYWWQDRDD